MNAQNKRLQDWLVEKIQTEYRNDISLLVGLDFDGAGNTMEGPLAYELRFFDFYVPETPRGEELGQTFILGGMGYDIYPRSWERLAGMAELNDYNTRLLGDGEIIYARSEKDRARFEALRQKLKDNLKDPRFCFRKALEKLQTAMELYQTMMFEESPGQVRMAAGFIADFLSVAIVTMNGLYFKQNQLYQMEELSGLRQVPAHFIAYYQGIIHGETMDELKKLAHLMIACTRKFLEEHKPGRQQRPEADFNNLAEGYQELCLTWRRLYYQCSQNDAGKAFAWGCALQHELNIMEEEFGLEQMDLLGAYNPRNLQGLAQRARELEERMICAITSHGAALRVYDTIEEFLAENE